MKLSLDILLSVFWFITVFCVIIGLVIFIMSQINPEDICQSLCNYHNGTFLNYECQGSIDNCMKTGWFCNYDNKSIPCNQLLDEINSAI